MSATGSNNPIYTTVQPLDPNYNVTPLPQEVRTTTAPTTPQQPQQPQYGFGLDFGRNVAGNELVSNQMNSLLSDSNPYIQNARQRGVEYANSRGLMNSSIAAGASQRAATEAALPIASADAAAYRSAGDQTYGAGSRLRELDVASRLADRSRMFDVQAQDWLANSAFNREFNGTLAMLPIASSMDMWNGLLQLAASDPAIFTPTVLAGYQDFFQLGIDEYMSRYLQGAAPTGPGG